MFCTKCGCKLKEGDRFCVKCGEPVVESSLNVSYNNSQTGFNSTIQPSDKGKRTKVIALSVIGVVVLCVLIVGGIFINKTIARNKLKEALQANTWTRMYDGDISLYLDFGEEKFDYSSYDMYTGSHLLSTEPYKVIDGETITVFEGEKEIHVEINGSTITFSPSFVDSASNSIWYKK